MRKNSKHAKRKHPKRRWCNDRQQAKQQAQQICSAIQSDGSEDMTTLEDYSDPLVYFRGLAKAHHDFMQQATK